MAAAGMSTKVFDLEPRMPLSEVPNLEDCELGHWSLHIELYKLSPFDPSSSNRKAIQIQQKQLTEQDVGQIFVRIFPHTSNRSKQDISYIPDRPLEESCQDSALELQYVTKNGTLGFFRKKRFAWEVRLDKSWNDCYWMTIPRYLEIINEAQQRMQRNS